MRSEGFTLIELVVVILLLGILAAVAVPKFFNLSDYQERAAYDEVAGAVRYAQKLAVASGHDVKVTFNSADDEYQLQQCDNEDYPHCECVGCDWDDLSKSYPVHNGPDENTKVPLSGPVIVFDALGQVIDEVSLAPLTGEIEIEVGSKKITVIAETGYVDAP